MNKPGISEYEKDECYNKSHINCSLFAIFPIDFNYYLQVF